MTKMTKKIFFILIILLLSFYPLFSQMMLQPVATVNLLRSEMISKESLDAKRASCLLQTADRKSMRKMFWIL